LIALLEANDEKDAKLLARALIIHFAKGNGTAMKEVLARVDGIVKEEHEHSGEVVIRVKRDRVEYPDASPGADENLSGSEDV